MMANRSVLVYAHGDDVVWEAICVDLDIAVQGRTQGEVLSLMKEALSSYVEDARKEDAATAARLLNRRSPLMVRARLWLLYHLSRLLPRPRERVFTAGVELPCHA